MTINTILTSVGAVLLVAVVGVMLLPNSAHVERSGFVAKPVDVVYAMVASNSGFQKFNPYKDLDADIKITLSGPDQGVSSGFAFASKDGTGTQVITAVEENKSVSMQIDLGRRGTPTQKFDLVAVDGGTQVIWSLDSEFGMNPIGRVMGLFLDKMVGGTFERGLVNMDKVAS